MARKPKDPIRDAIRQGLDRSGCSIRQMAMATNIHRPHLSNYLNGKIGMTTEEAARIFALLDIELNVPEEYEDE